MTRTRTAAHAGAGFLFPARFVLRLFRFEILASAAAAVASAAAGLVVAGRLAEVRPPIECLRKWALDLSTAGCPGNAEFLDRNQTEGAPVLALLGFMPFVIGGLLGAIATSRDLEEGAAPFAWSIYRSRVRWLAGRLAPLALLVAALAIIVMASADRLAAAGLAFAPLDRTFQDYGVVGLPVVAHALAMFGVGQLLGSLVGRQVPALLLTAAAAAGLWVALGTAMPFGEPLTAIDAQAHQATEESQLGMDFWSGVQMLRGPDGVVVSQEEALALAPADGNRGDARAWVDERYRPVDMVIPGDGRGRVEAREIALLALVFVISLGLGALRVARRRPY
jgi:hypothetical protein